MEAKSVHVNVATVGRVSLIKETFKSTYKFTLEISLMHALSVERVSLKKEVLKST